MLSGIASRTDTVDFKRSVLTGDTVDIPLTDEQLLELREGPDALRDFIFASDVRAMCALWIVAVDLVDDVPGRHSLPVAVLSLTKGVADDHVVGWFGGILEHLGGCPNTQTFATDGDPRLVRQFLRPVAVRVLGMDWGKMPRHLFMHGGERISLAYIPDLRHLLKNLRARAIKGRGAPVPCVGGCVVEVNDYVLLGMSLATVTDRSCYRQDDLKPEEMYRYVFLERSTNARSEALHSGRLEDLRRFASVYLLLFPAYCITALAPAE
jgi:hypothetical protein